MWRRRGTGLTYTALSWHKLLPTPSRGSGAAAVSVISAAAAVWRPGRDELTVVADGSGKENDSQRAAAGGSVVLRRRFGSSEASSDDGTSGSALHSAALQDLLGVGGNNPQPAASTADAADRWALRCCSVFQASADESYYFFVPN